MDEQQSVIEEELEAAVEAPSAPADDEFATIREHYEADELSDDELDAIADVAITYIREVLAFFGEEKLSID